MTPRAFRGLGSTPIERLRRIRGKTLPPDDEQKKAIARVFRTADGQVLLNYMILHSVGLTAPKDAPDSALREIEARKKFLDQILAQAEEPSANSQSQHSSASSIS